jgi:putative restriction endonuclease
MTDIKPFAEHTPARIRLAQRAWPLLVGLAASDNPLRTYGQIAPQLDTGPMGVANALSPIQSWCHENHKPYLQALIVSKKSGLPGEGYRGKRTKRAHAEEVRKVCAYRWPEEMPVLKDRIG